MWEYFSFPHYLKFILLQREELRARFPGVPGDLVNFFLYVAEEVIRLLFFFFFPDGICLQILWSLI